MEMRKRSLKNSLFLLIGMTLIITISACSSAPANPTIQPASAANPVAVAVEVATEPGEEIQAAPQVSPKTSPQDTINAPSADPQVMLEQPAPAVEAAPVNAETLVTSAADPAAQNNDAALAAPPAPAPAQSESVPAAQPQLDIETKPEVGFLAPDFALQTMDGQTVRLSELRGQPVVISYWATWCGPCKLELPILQSLAQQYAQTGIQILTVNAIEQDKVDAVQGLVSQMGLTMPVLLDQQNQFQSAYKQLFFPTSYFIDSNGIVRFIKLGDASEAELRGNVEKLINNQL